MDYTFYAPSNQQDYDKLISEVTSTLGEYDETQRSLTTMTLDCDDLDNPDGASVIISTKEWEVAKRFPKQEIAITPLDDIATIGTSLPTKRMFRLPPRKDADSWRSASPPFTSLHYNNDVVIATPEVVQILEAVQRDTGLDIESVVKDLEGTYNRDVKELNFDISDGLYDLHRHSEGVRENNDRLWKKVRTAFINIKGFIPNESLRNNIGGVLVDLIAELESGRSRMPEVLKENQITISILVDEYNKLEHALAGTLDLSEDVFVNTINQHGIGMPSIFETPNEAVQSVGFASRGFLHL